MVSNVLFRNSCDDTQDDDTNFDLDALLLEDDDWTDDDDKDTGETDDEGSCDDDETDDERQILEPVANARERLENMVGMESVKQKLLSYTQLHQFSQLREQNGLPGISAPLHAMFLGSPGTGKTTVAKIMGQLLKEAGVLSRGHVVVRERATLLGQFYNSEAEATLKALEDAQGGILFIDEAYQLHVPADPKDPGRWVLDTLMTALADESRRDWMLIMAGYTKPMLKMFEMNPGLASRIPRSNFYKFPDYSSEELMEIAVRWFNNEQFVLTPEAELRLKKLLDADCRRRSDDFGNARHIINLIQTSILPAMAQRTMQSTRHDAEQLSCIVESDIPQITTETLMPRRRPIGFTA